ncbi:MAG: Asp-tRNA(Asn)/Glu-tRNA(Gln) amidotransferase subunit GatB [Candidatus Sungbacteria bacterium]|nr:Asp-tRNA(Asn)/Glu-tRNA(Gln) amidotransferase subunit GatB [Candidatus Sungbacteria bacterium]
MDYEPIIGLEVHTELKTRTKMFCDCLNDPNETHPNTNICPVCLAHPGTLPVANKEAIEKVILVGMALHAEIPEFSQFDRKNYFYPDLPKGYQISQYEHPLVRGGSLEFKIPAKGEARPGRQNSPPNADPPLAEKFKIIRIQRIHLEEDTGRLAHGTSDMGPASPKLQRGEHGTSTVDFNRAGIPLMELVTEPDVRSAEEARRFAEELQLIIRYVGASDADMEKGQMRVEANVSLRPKGEKTFGTKVELKNINSFKFVASAIEYEIARQKKVLEGGGKVIQETRGWNEAEGITVSQRVKEGATDYRYFPEPDLPALLIDQKWMQSIRSKLTELPDQKRARFAAEFGLDEKTTELFIRDPELSNYFEKVISETEEWIKSMGDKVDPHTRISTGAERQDGTRSRFGVGVDRVKAIKLVSNYLTGDLQRLRNETGSAMSDVIITPENFAEFITLIYEGKLSSAAAKTVLETMFRTGADPTDVMREKNLAQESSEGALREIAEKVVGENPEIVSAVRSGKANAVQALVGAAMKVSGGKGNPAVLRELIEQIIKLG